MRSSPGTNTMHHAKSTSLRDRLPARGVRSCGLLSQGNWWELLEKNQTLKAAGNGPKGHKKEKASIRENLQKCVRMASAYGIRIEGESPLPAPSSRLGIHSRWLQPGTQGSLSPNSRHRAFFLGAGDGNFSHPAPLLPMSQVSAGGRWAPLSA